MKFLISIFVLVCLVAVVGLRAANVQSVDETPRLLDEYAVYSAVIGELLAGNKVNFHDGGVNRVDLLLIESRTVSNALSSSYPLPRLGLDKDFQPIATPTPIRIVPSYGSRESRNPRVSEYEAQVDFRFQNREPLTLRRLFNLNVDYVLIDSRETKRDAFAQEGKEVRGVVKFSRVGFNSRRTKAYVKMDYVCGSWCGRGYGIVLVKQGDVWKVEDWRLAWIA